MNKIHWTGDLANDPRSGAIIETANGLHRIQWDDGEIQTVPTFVVAGPRWRVA